MKRQRGRGRKSGGGGQHQNNRALESNGPDVKVRGAAVTIYEKYQQLARDASSAGDRVKAENYLQHAEHYFRIMRAQEESRQGRDVGREGGRDQGRDDQRQQQNQNHGQPRGQNRDAESGDSPEEARPQRNNGQRNDQRSESRNEARAEPRGNGGSEASSGGPLEVVTPEASDLGEAAAEKKPRRGRKPRARAEDSEAAEAAEDAA